MPPDSQPSQVAVAAAFRDDPSVVGVVGHTGSAQTLEAAPIYGDVEQKGRRALVAITPTATNPAVTRAGDWVFRVCPTDDDAARALARFAADSLRARRVAIVYRNDLFGRGFTRVIGPALARRGVTVVERDPYLAGITEYAAYAQRIARRRVDALVFAGAGADAAAMIRALRASGANPAVLGTDAVADVRAAGAPGEFSDVRFAAFFDPERATAAEQLVFIGDYRRRYGGLPDHQSALAYDAAMLIGRAAQAVGGNRRKIRDWVAAVGRGVPAHPGVTGVIRFDENGDAANKVVLIGRAAR
jgi:branched-chain amino acid transport system substrate-binding protein